MSLLRSEVVDFENESTSTHGFYSQLQVGKELQTSICYISAMQNIFFRPSLEIYHACNKGHHTFVYPSGAWSQPLQID